MPVLSATRKLLSVQQFPWAVKQECLSLRAQSPKHALNPSCGLLACCEVPMLFLLSLKRMRAGTPHDSRSI